jgi:hypothetical protein
MSKENLINNIPIPIKDRYINFDASEYQIKVYSDGSFYINPKHNK